MAPPHGTRVLPDLPSPSAIDRKPCIRPPSGFPVKAFVNDGNGEVEEAGSVKHVRDVKILGLRLYVWRLKRSPLRKEFHSRIADRIVSLQSAGWIVDVGCGPGLLEARIASRIGSERVVGVDIDHRMLRLASSGCNCEAVQATAACLPFKNESVDVVVSSASLKDWGDRRAGLSEVVRVMRPGATGLVYDFVTVGPGSRPEGFRRRFGVVSDLLRQLLRIAVRFTIDDAKQLASALSHRTEVSVGLEPDLGIVRIKFTKSLHSASRASADRGGPH